MPSSQTTVSKAKRDAVLNYIRVPQTGTKKTAKICLINTGKVYTPSFLADWLATELLSYLPSRKKFSIIDPACGDGELLHAIKRNCRSSADLWGTDIESQAVRRAKKNLGKGTFLTTDAVLPKRGESYSVAWKALLKRQSMDALIANPPWGADVLHNRSDLLEAGYDLAKGQFDSWDLFVELAVSLVKKSGVIALILPDAIFLPEHEGIRSLITSQTTILTIGRLGEGIFDNVYRGTTVLVLKNEKPKPSHQIDVFRLTKAWRDSIMGNTATLGEAAKALSHRVPQARFSNNTHSHWDIDCSEHEKSTIELITTIDGEWTKWLETGRGVELSKTGKVLLCPSCDWCTPYPREAQSCQCTNCGLKINLTKVGPELIVKQSQSLRKGWKPLIVGEAVDRYHASPKHMIMSSVAGINYKHSEIYDKRRILIRKTGVGIKASIVDAGPMINQVVYHYYESATHRPPEFYLSYVLGVLCSRTMFAYHLKKNGENEWRTHPYLTQKIISRFPIPVPREGEQSWGQAKAIAHYVDKLLLKNGKDSKTDMKIESLVAGLFQMKKEDIAWVKNAIAGAQQMEPMRLLGSFDISDVSALYV